jgi:hypothetical protein
MADNLAITPGAGASIATDQVSDASHAQLVKLAVSADADRTLVPATAANGMTVDVTRVTGNVTVVQATAANLKVDASGVAVPVTDNAGSITVDAPAATPVAVRLSTGAAFIDTIPVSIAGTVTVAGTVAVSGTVAATQSGTWNIATLTTITNPVTVTGTVALSGTSPVSGTVTANQGTAAAIANAWNVKVGDGVNPAGVTLVGAAYGLKVDVIQQVGGGKSQQDRTAFTDGTTFAEVSGGVFNDAMTSPGAGQSGYARITGYRAFHVNLRRNADGVELGIAATPVRTDPTGTTTQPVSGTVTVNQGATAWVTNITQIAGHAVVESANGIQKVGISDATGTAFSAALGVTAANALPVQNQPSITGFWRAKITYSASATDQVIRTPTGGKTTFVEGLIITPTAAGAELRIHDSADANAKYLYHGQPPLGSIVITPSRPIPLTAINAVLYWSTGGSATGTVVAWGYEA